MEITFKNTQQSSKLFYVNPLEKQLLHALLKKIILFPRNSFTVYKHVSIIKVM